MTEYVIIDENTLGYVATPSMFGVLHGSVLRGGHNWRNGPVFAQQTKSVRPATAKDFDDYLVEIPNDFRQINATN